MPHSITIDNKGYVWIVDRDANSIYKFTQKKATLLMIIPDKKNKTKTITNIYKINSLRGKLIKSAPHIIIAINRSVIHQNL